LFRVFDAAYVALAEPLDAPLITTDSRLARACVNIALGSSCSLRADAPATDAAVV
jgi:predicted nucleic acid-binding protein